MKSLEVHCKPGDTVYIKGKQAKVSFIHMDSDSIHYCCQFDCEECPCRFYNGKRLWGHNIDCDINGYIEFTAKDIGKTVFLSNQEVEK